MTGPSFAPVPAPPLLLDGGPLARGLGQARHPAADVARVAKATAGRVAQAQSEGLIGDEAQAYLAAQRAFHLRHDPAGMAELAGIASGFGIAKEALFTHLHLGTLRDLAQGARLTGTDGCSAWAVPDGAEGPMVVKNRDYSGAHLGIQTVALHSGPDIATGRWLAVGSLGSPGAYSSGMNARGLAIVDTQVAVRSHRVGWLRYFLMSHLLSRCGTVAEALAFIRAVPHAGGGTLVMADASGAIAAVELGAAGPSVTTGPEVWRTNHYVSADLADDTLPAREDRIAQNSRDRFRYLGARLPGRAWSAAGAARLMASHPDTEPGAAPLCQHAEGQASQTLSTSIYSCRLGTLIFSDANPCGGRWSRYDLPR